MTRSILYLCFALSISAAACGAFSYLTTSATTDPIPGLTVSDCEHDLQAVRRGSHEVASIITNHGAKPARLIGCGFGHISERICVGTKETPIAVIAPGDSLRFEYHVDLYEAGPFEATLILYLFDDNGFREVPLSVRGECVIAQKPRKSGDNPFATP